MISIEHAQLPLIYPPPVHHPPPQREGESRDTTQESRYTAHSVAHRESVYMHYVVVGGNRVLGSGTPPHTERVNTRYRILCCTHGGTERADTPSWRPAEHVVVMASLAAEHT